MVYIVGGVDKNGNILDIVQVFDIDTQTWSQLNDTLNIARSSASCNVYKGLLYVFGGTIDDKNNDTNSIEYYDLTTNDEWIQLNVNETVLTIATHDHHSILIGNIIFNIGGYEKQSYIMDAFVIDNYEDIFEIQPQTMPNVTHLYGIIGFDNIDGHVMMISGQQTNNGDINIIETLEYSNQLSIGLETLSPTPSPVDDDFIDSIQNEIFDLLKSDIFDPTTWTTFTTIVVIVVTVLLIVSCLAFCQHKCHCRCCGCRGADDVEWWRLARYSLQVYDLFTDMNFCVCLWMEWRNWSDYESISSDYYGDENISQKDINDQTTYHFYAAILSTVFLILPYLANLLYVLCPCGLPSLLSQPSYAESKVWMIARAKIFALLVILSGGVYASLTLVNSKMFGVAMFTMGLSRRQLLQFTDIQVKLSILLENLPQLALQLSVIFNRYLHQDIYDGFLIDMVTGMSLVSSAFLIIIGIISTCIIKSQSLDDLEITIDVNAIDKNKKMKKVIKKIHSCLGLRQSISRELSLVFGVEENVIEVPRIARTMYGCKIRLYIAKTDHLQTLNDLKKKVADVAKVLSLLFRVDVDDISLYLIATASDMVNAATSGFNLQNHMNDMRQLSVSTDFCNPRLSDDDELSSGKDDDEKDENL